VPQDKEVAERLVEARKSLSQYPEDDLLLTAARRIGAMAESKEKVCALVIAKQLIADWDALAEDMERLLGYLAREEKDEEEGVEEPAGAFAGPRPCLKPLAALYLPLPALVTKRVIVRHFAGLARSLPASLEAQAAAADPLPSLLAPRALRVGYVGSEFGGRSGPAGASLSGAWRAHNRTRVSVYLYALNSGDDRSEHLARGDFARDLTSAVDLEGAAEVIRADELDVVVFFSGHGVSAGTKFEALCAMRLAPVVVFAQGFMGTAGSASLVDWSITDRVLTPPETVDWYYAEKVAMMPEGKTFFASPHAELYPLSKEVKHDRLASSMFVFSCFNQVPKIDLQSFEAWMRVMKRVPRSVLWLFTMRGETEAPQRLRRHAALMGVDPERIYFFSLLPKDSHVWTKAKADLFLDTAVYGAHTTAADALWGGVPVVTKVSALPQSRVAASLLVSLGLPWLVTRTWREYEDTVVRLATDQKLLAVVREKITGGRERLFSEKRWVKAIDRRFQAMVDIKRARGAPRHIF
jgi:protein O-GlcNAc transferase